MQTKEIIIEKFGKCIEISNGIVELAVTIDLGPRIVKYNLIDGKNILNQIGKVDPISTEEYGDFYCYGGHRFWHAPEEKPRSYVPDNDPVKYEVKDDKVIFYCNFEKETGIQKNIIIKLDGNKAIIEHVLINKNLWNIKVAPWALTIVAPGGRLIIPNEPFIPHTDKLLPARPLVLWNYTNMADTRWTWGNKFTILRNDANLTYPQKIGLLDKLGWAAYELENTVFIKKFGYIEGAEYPDYNSNLETFTAGTFHEFETLAPLSELAANGGNTSYTETWSLFDNIQMSDCEDDIEKKLNSLL